MIYGKGLIAKELKKYENGLSSHFFAAGVSNSQCSNKEDYRREFRELSEFVKKIGGEKIIYYSSFVAVSGDSMYAEHKRNMERFLLEEISSCNILRLPQVVGVVNNSTLVSFFVKKILSEEGIVIQEKAKRRLISIEDVARLSVAISKKPYSNLAINIGPIYSMSAYEIAIKISEILNQEIKILFKDGGDEQNASLEDFVKIMGGDDIIFDKEYQKSVLHKYVPLIKKMILESDK
jgi:UDP-2-acetamido-2,6-beta-L-arabino-hexul-4-ose reductase